jgi:hypothetical protein
VKSELCFKESVTKGGLFKITLQILCRYSQQITVLVFNFRIV